MNPWVLNIGLALAGVVFVKREAIVDTVKNIGLAPRGIRLNNPGNIEINPANPWGGETVPSTDSRYAQFEHAVYGIRAIARTLNTYRLQYGLTTIRQVISRWAPDFENNTEAYISHVSQRSGLAENDDIRKNFAGVIAAIIHHENGQQPYTMELIQAAIDMASREL